MGSAGVPDRIEIEIDEWGTAQHGAVLDGALGGVRQGEGGSQRGEARAVGGGSGGLAHRWGVEIPEGIHLEFLPSGSPELMPAERLWPLTNEAVATRLF